MRQKTSVSRLNARVTDPATSVEAAKAAAWSALPLAMKLLVQYQQHPLGLTDEQAAVLAQVHSTGVGWWKRCSDLRAAGLILPEPFQTRISPITGFRQQVCRITADGSLILTDGSAAKLLRQAGFQFGVSA